MSYIHLPHTPIFQDLKPAHGSYVHAIQVVSRRIALSVLFLALLVTLSTLPLQAHNGPHFYGSARGHVEPNCRKQWRCPVHPYGHE